MARLGVAGVALALVLAPEIASAQVGAPPMPNLPPPLMNGPMAGAPTPNMPPPPMMRPPMAPPGAPLPPMAGPRGPGGPGGPPDGRWAQVPGGWGAYHAPSYGYTLPRYWVAQGHYINDYAAYGLPAPAFGYGWSRYYDDMVLTDRWGRVYDWRDGRDARGPGPGMHRRKRDRSGIVGAIVGGAVGAVTGNIIAGAGSRLAGSLIGGGVGALAGQAVDSGKFGGDDGYRRDGHGYGYGYGYGYTQRAQGPHWFMGDYNGGYSCGCGQTVTTTTTTYAQPIVTKKVRYVTEYVRVPVKTKYRAVRTKDRYLGGS